MEGQGDAVKRMGVSLCDWIGEDWGALRGGYFLKDCFALCMQCRTNAKSLVSSALLKNLWELVVMMAEAS